MATGSLRRPLRRLLVPLSALALLVVPLPGLASPPQGNSTGRAADGPLAAASGDPPGDWTTLGGSANRSGYTNSPGPATAPPIAWERCLGSGPVRTGPVLAGVRAFVSTSSGAVFSLNLSGNGATLWKGVVGPGPTTGDLAGPLLLIGSTGGNLSAFNASTGATVWTRPLGGAPVEGVASRSGVAYVGTSTGQLVALQVSNGSPIWSVSVGAPVAGSVAAEGASVYVTTTDGYATAVWASNGSVRWRTPVGATVAAGAAVSGPTVVVGDASGNVSALSASDGSVQWRWAGRSLRAGESISAPPSIGPGRVVVSTDLGELVGLDRSTGRLLWNRSSPYAGYPVRVGPLTTPGVVYAVGATEQLVAVQLLDGKPVWSTSLDGGAALFSSPALSGGSLVIGDDAGCVLQLGFRAGIPIWPLEGTVRQPSGAPVSGVNVTTGGHSTTSLADGSFQLELPSGSYTLYAYRALYVELIVPLLVEGPVTNLSIILNPLALFRLTGTIVDSRSGLGVPDARVLLQGQSEYAARTVTDRRGSFDLLAGNGSNRLTIAPPNGYDALSVVLTVPGRPVSGVVLIVEPTGLSIPGLDPYRLDLLLPLGGLTVTLLGLWVVDYRRRRRLVGLSTAILSRFGRYVAMRVLLIPGEVASVLALLYLFGTFLPAAAIGRDPCRLTSGGCASCSWGSPACVLSVFGNGFWTFLSRLATGDWGIATYGYLAEPASLFLSWWLPYSVELALVALAISVAIAYPVGVLSGARRDSAIDVGSRLGAVVGLLVPSFLILLLIFGAAYGPFSRLFGDDPYGLVPSSIWFNNHGGHPAWFGIAGNTSPTGFPLVDSLWHHDLPFAELVAAKTLLQALVIALIYVAIYLRYLRNAVARAIGAPSVVAARALGLDEGTILWRHAGRQLLPTYLLVFGSTVPAYIGAQALVEAISNDTGLGSLLLHEVISAPLTGFGFSHGMGPSGNFYQVAIFLTVLLVLFARLAADILARHLDPRLLEEGRP